MQVAQNSGVQSAARHRATPFAMAADGSGSGGFGRLLPITHDFVATMMGTDPIDRKHCRPQPLQKKGIIRVRDGGGEYYETQGELEKIRL